MLSVTTIPSSTCACGVTAATAMSRGLNTAHGDDTLAMTTPTSAMLSHIACVNRRNVEIETFTHS
ncbi:MAG TPA: hypothetical protein VIJ86_09040 [Acidimicrobiales bacterium]